MSFCFVLTRSLLRGALSVKVVSSVQGIRLHGGRPGQARPVPRRPGRGVAGRGPQGYRLGESRAARSCSYTQFSFRDLLIVPIWGVPTAPLEASVLYNLTDGDGANDVAPETPRVI